MDRTDFERWIDGYERAWRTPGTEALADLFTESASYSMAPFEPAHEGLDAIARLWEAEREGSDASFEMNWELVAVEGDTGVARVEVRYADSDPGHYRDLWVIRLAADGRCSAFEEWPFSPPGSVGGDAPGPTQA
jgi:SnoaL-like domain